MPGKEIDTPNDACQPVEVGARRWRLHPHVPLVTIGGVDIAGARQVRAALESVPSERPGLPCAPISPILHDLGARWQELDAYAERFRPVYMARLTDLRDASRRCSDLEEEDIRHAAMRALTTFFDDALEILNPAGDDPAGNWALVDELMYRTYHASLQNVRRRQTFESGPLRYAITLSAILDDRSCPECRTRNGSIAKPGSPPLHIGCRCCISGRLED